MSEKCHICDVNEHEKNKKALITRLNRIEGQVKGVKKMIEEDIYCGFMSISWTQFFSFFTHIFSQIL